MKPAEHSPANSSDGIPLANGAGHPPAKSDQERSAYPLAYPLADSDGNPSANGCGGGPPSCLSC